MSLTLDTLPRVVCAPDSKKPFILAIEGFVYPA